MIKITYDKNMIIENEEDFIVSFYINHNEASNTVESNAVEYYCRYQIYKDEIYNKYFEINLRNIIFLTDTEKEDMLQAWTSELWYSIRIKNHCYFFDSLFVECFFDVDNLTTVYTLEPEGDFCIYLKYKTKHEVLLDNDYLHEPKFLSFWKTQYDDENDNDYQDDNEEEEEDISSDEGELEEVDPNDTEGGANAGGDDIETGEEEEGNDTSDFSNNEDEDDDTSDFSNNEDEDDDTSDFSNNEDEDDDSSDFSNNETDEVDPMSVEGGANAPTACEAEPSSLRDTLCSIGGDDTSDFSNNEEEVDSTPKGPASEKSTPEGPAFLKALGAIWDIEGEVDPIEYYQDYYENSDGANAPTVYGAEPFSLRDTLCSIGGDDYDDYDDYEDEVED